MTKYQFKPVIYSSTFGPQTPVFHLAAGDVVSIPLLDAHGYDSQGNRQVEFSNPLVGPFYIDDLVPGDSLSVILEEIQPNRNQGWSYIYPTATTLEPDHFATIPSERKMISWDVDVENGTAQILHPGESLAGLKIPIKPMIGCLGVAPALSQAITSYASGSFGGNMDCPLLTSDCRVDFPVFVNGGLLFIGDMHAAQSHGEICGAAIEVAGVVRFSVQVNKGQSITWPHGENAKVIFTIGTGRPLDIALQRATSEMLRWLVADFNLTIENAAIVMSQSVQYVINNAVNDQSTIACVLPKVILGVLKRK